ncbi:flagellar hook-length control protein FliK [Roseomonas sp. OT10]|uniref:flagellar hook-length control protein FliK n=1 Tax=Roseomonas cutis TaxID=2897332 RepID=UPI001E2C83BF|nr:flagellar hook-length control protein FliK [Roseomonas sp. OT10]UFN48291.1 flagellar hook-length control protein FliK [Roseomonas sp. OT10]
MPAAALSRSAPPPAAQVAPVVVGLSIGAGTEARIEMVLEPAELGRVEISIDRTKEQAAVQIAAERPETLALLQRDQRELDRALSQAGLAPQGGLSLSFSLFGSGAETGAGDRGRGQGRAARGPGAPGAGIPAAALPPRALRGLLDIAI